MKVIQQTNGLKKPTDFKTGPAQKPPHFKSCAQKNSSVATPTLAALPRYNIGDISHQNSQPVMQLQKPWWKYGLGMLGGALAGFAGYTRSSPWLGIGGAVLGAGSAYLAYKDHQKSKVKLEFPAHPDFFNKIKNHQELDGEGKIAHSLKDDPKFQFDEKTKKVTSHYSGQELSEQYPGLDLASLMYNKKFSTRDSRKTLDNLRYQSQKYDASFAPEDVKTEKEKKRKALLASTKEQVNNFDFNKVRSFRDASDESEIVESLLSKHSGVIFGESHSDSGHKTRISKQMPALKKNGVNTLYLEHFRTDHQSLLDSFLGGPEDTRMPSELERYIENHDKVHNAGSTDLMNLMMAAKEHEMRVKGIDSPEANEFGDGNVLRAATMNKVAHDVITKDTKSRKNGKYVVLTGQAHSHTHPLDKKGGKAGLEQPAPGLSQLLDIPAVTIDEKTDNLRLDEDKKEL